MKLCIWCGFKPQKVGMYCCEEHHQLHRKKKIENYKVAREHWEKTKDSPK